MKRNLFMSFAVLLMMGCGASDEIELFNGKDLSGWQIYGTEKWYVENGVLVSESGPDAEYGYLGTTENYKDFELTAEFKQDQDGNSGIFFRSTFEGTKVSGWQVEVAPPGNDTGGIYESYGRGWLIKPDPEKDKNLKFGEWNDIKVRVQGNQVTTWLNGVEMVDYSDEKIGQGEGQIALQIHSGGGLKISWRNLRLKQL
ncbi:3-keto-disaccharide hydrolase [Lunatimonas salinarum]|uniref:3-keto-disaccharide hydrolase n=1 Tax=Lunatimonas salinarum TaxID=1774590 RepID=UPI001ADF03A1